MVNVRGLIDPSSTSSVDELAPVATAQTPKSEEQASGKGDGAAS
jgi:hypothetical protein